MTKRLRWLCQALCALFVVCGLLPAVAQAQIPQLIRYQGQLTDSNGVGLEGPYNLTFRIYDALSAGAKLWEEAQTSVQITSGQFSVLLGQVTSLAAMDWSSSRWISVQVNTDPELTPRQQISSVPMALVAERLDGVLTTVGDKVGVGTKTPDLPLVIDNSAGAGALSGSTVKIIGKWGGTDQMSGLIIDNRQSANEQSRGARLLLTTANVPGGRTWAVVGGALNLPSFQIYDFTADRLRLVIDTSGNVGIGTNITPPTNLLTIQQGSPTDPIADSWTVYPSDRKHKRISRTNPQGYLAQVKAMNVYEWTRAPFVSDEEARSATGKEEPSADEQEEKRRQLEEWKATLPKFSARRVGMVIDDPNIPPEVLAFNADGTAAGIDLLAYMGYLHAALKEAALKIDELESRLPPAQTSQR